MSDGLSQLSTKLIALGFPTPLLSLPRPFTLSSLASLSTHLQRVKDEIAERGIPKRLGPLVVAVTGKGRVGKGARWVLERIGAKWVTADQLKGIMADPGTCSLLSRRGSGTILIQSGGTFADNIATCRMRMQNPT